jgi:CRISPR-associated protein Cas1
LNPLYVDSQRVGLGIDGFSLYIKNLATNRLIEKFEPRNIPYDSIFLQRSNGYVSLGALNWLVKHAVSLTVLNWRGHVLAQFLPEEPVSNELKIAQVEAYKNREKHLAIARTLVETKLWRQSQFLKSLSNSYDPNIPILPRINTNSEDFLRNIEARYATAYFTQFGSVCSQIGYNFKKRNQTKSNMHAADLPNGLLNYGYSVLQTYTKRALNATGLDLTIPFLHGLRRNYGLVYDMMELFRSNIDYSVLQALKELKRSKRTHYLTDGYEVMLERETVKVLIEKIRFNLHLEELLFNARIFAKYLLQDKKTLEFALKPIQVKPLFEQDRVKSLILTKTARELGMNKSTHWYQRKMLKENGTLSLYRKTRQYYV